LTNLDFSYFLLIILINIFPKQEAIITQSRKSKNNRANFAICNSREHTYGGEKNTLCSTIEQWDQNSCNSKTRQNFLGLFLNVIIVRLFKSHII
ncbi:hypothetical protein BpHYR1_016044, partial [Brachionus plicatilis]